MRARTAEREAAIEMLADLPGAKRQTVGADKGYYTADCVTACRKYNVTPHVACNIYEYTTKTGKPVRHESAVDQRTTRYPG